MNTPVTNCNTEKMPDFCHLCKHIQYNQFERSPNWIHVLCVTSFFKNEHPHITVSQNAYGNRKPRHLWCLERTPVSLSPRGENCVASLFVRVFTSLLMSTQIKMTIQSEGSESTIAPTYSISWEKKMQWEQKPPCVWLFERVCTCMHVSISTCSESEVVFGMREDNLEV